MFNQKSLSSLLASLSRESSSSLLLLCLSVVGISVSFSLIVKQRRSLPPQSSLSSLSSSEKGEEAEGDDEASVICLLRSLLEDAYGEDSTAGGIFFPREEREGVTVDAEEMDEKSMNTKGSNMKESLCRVFEAVSFDESSTHMPIPSDVEAPEESVRLETRSCCPLLLCRVETNGRLNYSHYIPPSEEALQTLTLASAADRRVASEAYVILFMKNVSHQSAALPGSIFEIEPDDRLLLWLTPADRASSSISFAVNQDAIESRRTWPKQNKYATMKWHLGDFSSKLKTPSSTISSTPELPRRQSEESDPFIIAQQSPVSPPSATERLARRALNPGITTSPVASSSPRPFEVNLRSSCDSSTTVEDRESEEGFNIRLSNSSFSVDGDEDVVVSSDCIEEERSGYLSPLEDDQSDECTEDDDCGDTRCGDDGDDSDVVIKSPSPKGLFDIVLSKALNMVTYSVEQDECN